MRTTLICVVGLQIKSYTNSILQKAAAASATCRHSCLITHTLTDTHTYSAHMPAICDALKLANICLPAFCCFVLFSCPRALGGGGRHFVARVSHVLLLPPLLSFFSPLRLPLPGVSFVHACHARKKKAGGRAPKQRVSKQQAQQKQLLKRSYR